MPEERAIPLLGNVALTAVQRLEHWLDAGFAAQSVVGLPGQVQQHMGRRSHVIHIAGTLHGESYADDLAALQTAAADATPLTFAADIVTALELSEVVIERFHAVESAGEFQLARYELVLREDPPLPPPAEVSGFGDFGGLDGFGLGDLGFDTDIMGDLASLAGDIAGAVEGALDAAAALQALAGLGDLGFGGELQPLEDSVGRIGEAAAGFQDAIGGLGRLFG